MSPVHRLLKRIIDKGKIRPLAESMPNLEAWFDSGLGAAMLAEEQLILDEELGYMFGYHLMQMGITRKHKLYDKSRILHCFDVASIEGQDDYQAGLVSDLESLPLADESVDVSVLHHTLEFSNNPHAVLKEASRVTIPKGYIIIFGFNPFSPMGLVKPFAQLTTNKSIWRRDSLRRSRVSDWLKLVDCKTKRHWFGFYHLPINNQRYLERFKRTTRLLQKWRMPFGSFYCIIAQKDVQCLTPIRPKWEKEALINGVPLPKRSASASSAARLALIKPSKPSKPQSK